MKKSQYIFKQAKCELKTPAEHEEIKRTKVLNLNQMI
jgi:hypothetical protein